jgi:hypothetical protein
VIKECKEAISQLRKEQEVERNQVKALEREKKEREEERDAGMYV